MRAEIRLLTAVLAAALLCSACAEGGAQQSPDKTSQTAESSQTTDASKTVDGSEPAESSAQVTPERLDEKMDLTEEMKKEAVNGKISLTIWCQSAYVKFEKELIGEFSKRFEDSDLSFDIKVNGPYGQYDTAPKLMEDPENAADVIVFSDSAMNQLQEGNYISAVPELIAENVRAEQSEEVISAAGGSSLYAYPLSCDDGYYLFYDKRVYTDSADIETMDGMIEKAKENEKSVYMNFGNPWYTTSFFMTAGVYLKHEDGKQTADFDSPQGLSAAKAMCHIAENEGNGFEGYDGGSGSSTDPLHGFANGTLSAAVTVQYEAPTIRKAIGEENVGVSKLPTVLMDGEQKQLHSFGGYKLMGVNAKTKCPLTAHILSYYLTTADSQLRRYQEKGIIPSAKEAREDPGVRNDPLLQAIEAQMPYSHSQYSTVGSGYWAVREIFDLGEKTVLEKGKLTDEQLEAELKEIQKHFD